MKTPYTLGAILLVLAGCDTPEQAAIRQVSVSAENTRAAESVIASAKYVKDPRTGFCFAYAAPGPHGIAMTMVPCSGEVEQLIKTNPK